MTRIRIAALLAFPILAACSERNPIAPRAAAVAATVDVTLAASSLRPAGGRCDTDVTNLPPLAGDPPNLVRLHLEFVCQLKHLGRVTGIAEQIVIFTGPTTGIAFHTATYIAANGDNLFASFTGNNTITGPNVAISGSDTYTGGTGRFAGASGSASISGAASLITNTGQFTLEGTLSY